MYWLERRGVPGWLAITLVISTVFVILVGVGALVVQSANAFTAKLPFYQERLTLIFAGAVAWLEPLGVELSRDMLVENFNPGTAFTLAGNALAGLGGALSNSFLILLTGDLHPSRSVQLSAQAQGRAAAPRGIHAPLRALCGERQSLYGHQEQHQHHHGLIVTLFLSLLGWIFPSYGGFWPSAELRATIGSIIAAVPAVLLALVELGPLYALLVALGYMLLNVGLGNFVEPRFMGRGWVYQP